MSKRQGPVESGDDPNAPDPTSPAPVEPPVDPSGSPPVPPGSETMGEGLKALKIELEGKMEALQTAILTRMPSLDGLRDEIAKALEFIDTNPLADAEDVLLDLVDSTPVRDAVASSSWAHFATLLGKPIADLMGKPNAKK